jgi:thiamine-phosphate pyrophosphorylase
MKARIEGLYAVTPDLADTGELLARARAALEGGARALQYRNKSAGTSLRLAQAQALLALCREHGVPLIVNDDPEIALAVGADGVHLGAGDGSPRLARRRLGAGAILGVSCYDRLELAREAAEAGADYVAFGSFFPSPVKPGAVRAPLSLLERAKGELALAVVAIGGITLENAPRVIAAGADAIAVISALFFAPDIRGAARAFGELFAIRQP